MNSLLDLFEARRDFIAAADYTMPETVAYCRENGVDLDEARAHAGAIAIVRANFGRAYFDLADAGDSDAVSALCVEVFGDDDETCVDLVAWPVSAPARFATIFGRAEMLGTANVYSAATYVFGDPLRLWRTPLRWLQDRCRGAVAVRPVPAARRLLDAPGPIAAEDPDHAREIAAAFDQLDYRKRIVVPALMEKAA